MPILYPKNAHSLVENGHSLFASLTLAQFGEPSLVVLFQASYGPIAYLSHSLAFQAHVCSYL